VGEAVFALVEEGSSGKREDGLQGFSGDATFSPAYFPPFIPALSCLAY